MTDLPRAIPTDPAEQVDPDLLIAREIVAELWPTDAGYYLSGRADKINEVRSALAAIKRVRAMERGEG